MIQKLNLLILFKLISRFKLLKKRLFFSGVALYILIEIHSHYSVVCLTTSLSKRVLHRVRSSTLSFNFQYLSHR